LLCFVSLKHCDSLDRAAIFVSHSNDFSLLLLFIIIIIVIIIIIRGCAALTERDVHDLFYNLRILSAQNDMHRVRIFAAFAGCEGKGSAADDRAVADELMLPDTRKAALHFYLRILLKVSVVNSSFLERLFPFYSSSYSFFILLVSSLHLLHF
jgi:hypothetical protein